MAKEKPKAKRENKIRNLMLAQTEEQKAQYNIDIPYLMETLLESTVTHKLYKYKKTFEKKLSLSEDDLLNDIREQIWKGLLTYNPKAGANLETYLCRLIDYRFQVLLERSALAKYNSVEYYSDVYASASIDKEYTETKETGETLLQQREEFMQNLAVLSETDQLIYKDLLLGCNLNEMIRRNKLPREEVIRTIKRLDSIIKLSSKE